MIPDKRSALRKGLSGLYWRMRWRLRWRWQIRRRKERLREDARRIAECPLFDAAWYLAFYSDVADTHFDPAMHYLLHGASEGRDPGPRFSTMGYVGRYADVTNSGLNPLIHYIEVGAAEGREIGTCRVQSKRQRVLCICGEPDSVGSPYRVANLVSAFAAAGAGACGAAGSAAWACPSGAAPAPSAASSMIASWAPTARRWSMTC